MSAPVATCASIERYHLPTEAGTPSLNHYRWTTNEGVEGRVTFWGMEEIVSDPSLEELSKWFNVEMNTTTIHVVAIGEGDASEEVTEKCQWIYNNFVKWPKATLWMTEEKRLIIEFDNGHWGYITSMGDCARALKITKGLIGDAEKQRFSSVGRDEAQRSLYDLDFLYPVFFEASFTPEDLERMKQGEQVFHTGEGVWYGASRNCPYITANTECECFSDKQEPLAYFCEDVAHYRCDDKGHPFVVATLYARM